MLTVHLIPNAHLDPAWLWDWREGMNEGIATCYTMAELMEENKDVTFSRNEAFIYEHIEKHHPELFDRIKELVKEGRWEIVGGAMLQPDTNLGSGESYVRQYLYGQKYFQSRFGYVPEVAYQVDSFGHGAGLPTIYREAGCKYALHCRPGSPVDSRIYRWQGPDGSELLTAHLEGYCHELPGLDTGWGFSFNCLTPQIQRIRDVAPKNTDHWVLMVGVGDHGGGLNRKILAELREHMANPPEGIQFKFSTLKDFFAAIEPSREKFPTYKGELQYVFRGCYTSVAPIKQANRRAENLADRAERWATVADMLGKGKYPLEKTKQIWTDVVFNQFHDILAGSSLERVNDDSLDHYGRAKHEAREVENSAALSVFLDVDTRANEGIPVMVFNPHGTAYQGQVEAEWSTEYRPIGPGGDKMIIKHAVALGPDGRRYPTQLIHSEGNIPCEWRKRSIWIAEVPPMGYSVYWLQPADEDIRLSSPVTLTEGDGHIIISNGLIEVRYLSGENGVHVTDVRTGKEWFRGTAGQGVVLEDMGDSWGNTVDSWKNEVGRFEVKSCHIMHRGPLMASIVLKSEYDESQLIQEYILYPESNRVHCKARLLWNQPLRMCKIEFPINISSPKGIYDTPYAIVERPEGLGETPANKWAAVVGEDGNGIGVANDGAGGHDLVDNKLRMSVVRSPVYGSMVGGEVDTDAGRQFMDIGLHRFRYVIAPYNEVATAAEELNMPVHVTMGFPHEGKGMPAKASVVSVCPETVQLVAAKKAEDGSGWIVRLWEHSGKRQEAELCLFDDFCAGIVMQPWELKTIKLRCEGDRWFVEQASLTER